MIVSTLVLSVVAITAFTQTFPVVTIPQPAKASLTPNCTSLTAETIPAIGSQQGLVVFDCGSSTSAFTATNGPVSATPTFVLGTGYTTLFVIQGTPTTDCSSGTTFHDALTSGSVATPLSNGDYSYCTEYNVPLGTTTLGTFNVNWA